MRVNRGMFFPPVTTPEPGECWENRQKEIHFTRRFFAESLELLETGDGDDI